MPNQTKVPGSIHDRLVKSTLSNKERAKEFLMAHLSEKARKYVDLDSQLEIMGTDFNIPGLKHMASDVIIRTKIKGQTGYIYLDVAHQSGPEYILPLRMLMYNCLLMMKHYDKNKKEIVPIINIILYHGKESPYPYPKTFSELLENHGVAKEMYLEAPILIDLSEHSDEEIESHEKVALLELCLKYGRKKGFYNKLLNLKREDRLIELLNVKDASDTVYRDDIVNYVLEMISKTELIDEEKIKDLFLGMSERLDSEFMNIAQVIEKRGIEKGILRGKKEGLLKGKKEGLLKGKQEGILEGKREGIQERNLSIAKNMLSLGLDVDVIVKATGLPKSQIVELKNLILVIS